jgi:hypothetical protein
VVESTVRSHASVQGVLAGMAERRVAQVVRESDRLRQVFLKAKLPGNRSTDLCDFQAVRQSRAMVIVGNCREDLRLAHQSAKCCGMDDPFAVTLK